jgi:hypothetical protein
MPSMQTPTRKRVAAVVASLGIATLAAWMSLRASRAVLEHASTPVYEGDPGAERAIARGAASWGPTEQTDYDTGSELFDREWAFGAPAMRAACLAQVILRDPSADAELGPELDRATAEILAPKSRAFSHMKWGSDPLDEDRTDHDHAAYYGYAGLAVGLASWAHPKWEPARRDLANRLRERVRTAGDAWPETYPGEAYPPDLAMGAGALGLDDEDQLASAERMMLARRVASAVEPSSGLLVQSVDPVTGSPRDGARGSGTFLALYALLYADVELAGDLQRAGRSLRATRLGFLGMREHLEGTTADIDSGPVILDLGVSATGFALAGARAFRDEETFLGLDATARLFAVPLERDDGGVVSLAGGPLGDAILCAMRTAPRPDEVAAWRARTRNVVTTEGTH